MCLAIPGKVSQIEMCWTACVPGVSSLRHHAQPASIVTGGQRRRLREWCTLGFAHQRGGTKTKQESTYALLEHGRPRRRACSGWHGSHSHLKYLERNTATSKIAHALLRRSAGAPQRPWVLMEICGGPDAYVDALMYRRPARRKRATCARTRMPVCVTPLEMIDRAIALARLPEVTLVSYGDMLRVPGSETVFSFEGGRRRRDVRVVYSPTDAVELARSQPGRQVVSLRLGLRRQRRRQPWSCCKPSAWGCAISALLVSHVLVPPAIRTLLSSPKNRVQGIHRARPCLHRLVGNARLRKPCVREFHVPIVVGGFEPIDLLEGDSHARGATRWKAAAEVENLVTRDRCSMKGTGRPQRLSRACLKFSDRKWAGIGPIPESGLRLKENSAAFDAERYVRSRGRLRAEEPSEVHQRGGSARPQETHRLFGVWNALHARKPLARQWYPRKVRVRPITNTGATSLHSDSVSKDETKDLAAFSCPCRSGRRAHPSGPRQRRNSARSLLQTILLPGARKSSSESPGRSSHRFLERRGG